MPTVKFTSLQESTQEDWDLVMQEPYDPAALRTNLLEALTRLAEGESPFRVTRYEHCVQTASRALRDGRDAEYVTMALLHDIGDTWAPFTHDEMIAAILKPFIREELHWAVKVHGIFQLPYYGHFVGLDPNARDKFRDHPWFECAADFCELYDSRSFDPAYRSLDLTEFLPLLDEVLAEPRYVSTGASATR